MTTTEFKEALLSPTYNFTYDGTRYKRQTGDLYEVVRLVTGSPLATSIVYRAMFRGLLIKDAICPNEAYDIIQEADSYIFFRDADITIWKKEEFEL